MLINPIDLKKLDLIILEDISFQTIIGILPHERIKKQEIILNIVLGVNIKKASKSEKIEDATDYRFIKTLIEELKETKFELVETFIEFIAEKCLNQKGVREVFIKLSKPEALKDYAKVSLAVFRREDGLKN